VWAILHGDDTTLLGEAQQRVRFNSILIRH